MKFKRGDILKIYYGKNARFLVKMTYSRYYPSHDKHMVYGIYLNGWQEGNHDRFLAYSRIEKLTKDDLMVEML